MANKEKEKRQKRKMSASTPVSEPARNNSVNKSNLSEISGRQLGSQYLHYDQIEQIVPGPNRVVVTASNRRGEGSSRYQEHMHKNVPPPRLHPSVDHEHDDYKIDYPGAHLRLIQPQPSHLSELDQHTSPSRTGDPQSIIFGSSSKSRGSYYIQRQEPRHDEEEYYERPGVGRPPINFYNPAVVRSTTENFRPSKPLNPGKIPIRRPKPPNFHPPNQESIHQGEDNHSSRGNKRFKDIPSAPSFRSHETTTTLPLTSHNTYTSKIETDPSLLSTLTQLGPRRHLIDHKINLNHRTQSNSSPISQTHESRDQSHKLEQLEELSQDVYRIQNNENNYDREETDDRTYRGFVRGEVYSPATLFPRPRRPSHRITTRRPGKNRAVPYEDTRGSYVPRYKTNIQEMEFNPKTLDTLSFPSIGRNNGVGIVQNLPSSYWFLMPVQAWFTLSVVLAAVVVVLTIVCIILYYSLSKQRKKVRKLLSPSMLLGSCIDPLHHELCTCRSITTLMRAHASPMARASMMSRMSHRGQTGPGGVMHGNNPRSGVITYDNAPQQQMTTGFRSLPTPSIREREQNDEEDQPDSINTTHTQIDDSPPPLAPKMSIGQGSRTESMSSTKPNKYQDSFTLKRGSSRSSHHHISHSKYEKPPSGGSKLGSKQSSDVQLTTIYPPPSRFEL